MLLQFVFIICSYTFIVSSEENCENGTITDTL